MSKCIWATAQNLRVFKHLLQLNSVSSSGPQYQERYSTTGKKYIKSCKLDESYVLTQGETEQMRNLYFGKEMTEEYDRCS